MKDWKSQVKESYDTVADEYVKRISDELKDKPLDQKLLKRFADESANAIVCDVGCGPGHVARFLKDCGANVRGVDLSPEMILRARALNPDIDFQVDDMTALSVADGVWDGIVSFYSIVNIPPTDLLAVFREMHRALRFGGRLLLSFHIGDEAVRLEEWWDKKVAIDFYFFQSQSVAALLGSAGFLVQEIIERPPYPEIEHPSRRAYLTATKS